MDFTSQDIALIEQALHLAIQTDRSEQSKQGYQEVLMKLRNRAREALHAESMASSPMDGFRYDYDDSSDLT